MPTRTTRWQSIAIVAAMAVTLTSCRGPHMTRNVPPAAVSGSQAAMGYPAAGTLPPGAYGPAMAMNMPGEAEVSSGPYPPCPAPAGVAMAGSWAPPGLPQPWPQDEYLADGGDDGNKAVVGPEWQVHGLEPEDTVAHYDTLDGRRMVEPSNRVHIYSPRFASVRQVSCLQSDEQMTQLHGMHLPTKIVRHDETIGAVAREQREQLVNQVARNSPTEYQTRQGDGAFSQAVGLKAVNDGFLPFENFAAIRLGQIDMGEMPFLAMGTQAAVAWTHKEGVQVIIDRQRAMEEVGDQKVESVFTVKFPNGRPQLRIIKIASTASAKPGEFVDFTLRFDNTGNQLIGNVTIIDNLTTRLEYIPDSAKSSVPSNFSTEVNQAESLALRWEVTDPVKPGEGGIIRFRCKVR